MSDDPNAAPRRSRSRGAGGPSEGPSPDQDGTDELADALEAPTQADADPQAVDAGEPAAEPDTPAGAVDAAAEPTADAAEPAEPDEPVELAEPESPAPVELAELADEADQPAALAEPEPEPEPGREAPTTLWSGSAADQPASLPWLQARSLDDRICPFLRAAADDDSLGFPVEAPDPVNRCASMRDAVPQSLRQQELVCLTASHTNCPRYLRGAVVAGDVATPRVRTKAVLTPAISAALIILALSFGASVVFGLANGGLVMPSSALATRPAPSATTAAGGANASSSPSRTTAPASTPLATAKPPPSPSATTAEASIAPSPSAAPAATPAPTAKPTAAGATPIPTSGRYKLLKPCPDKPNCWVYRIRSGDNLFSIAKYFGVPLKKVKALNPWTETTRLKAGQKLILPNPTR